MAFAIGIWEFLIISGTVVGVGGGVAYSEITRKRNKVDESQIADPVLKQKEKILVEINKKEETKEEKQHKEEVQKDIETSHKENIKITELVLKGPRGFTFTDNSKSKTPEPNISITIDFALEPDSENWKSVEEQKFKLPTSGTSIVKRWIQKDSSDGSEKNKVECRYTWSEEGSDDPKKTTGVATDIYSELKKLLNTAKTKCTNAGGKGLTDTSPGTKSN